MGPHKVIRRELNYNIFNLKVNSMFSFGKKWFKKFRVFWRSSSFTFFIYDYWNPSAHRTVKSCKFSLSCQNRWGIVSVLAGKHWNDQNDSSMELILKNATTFADVINGKLLTVWVSLLYRSFCCGENKGSFHYGLQDKKTASVRHIISYCFLLIFRRWLPINMILTKAIICH